MRFGTERNACVLGAFVGVVSFVTATFLLGVPQSFPVFALRSIAVLVLTAAVVFRFANRWLGGR